MVEMTDTGMKRRGFLKFLAAAPVAAPVLAAELMRVPEIATPVIPDVELVRVYEPRFGHFAISSTSSHHAFAPTSATGYTPPEGPIPSHEDWLRARWPHRDKQDD